MKTNSLIVIMDYVSFLHKLKGIRRYQRGRQKSLNRQSDHGQQNETKDKHKKHNTTLKTKDGVTRTLK